MRKNLGKRMLVIAAAAMMLAASLTGCGKTAASDKGEVVATLGDEKIYLKEANLYARVTQAQYESAYMAYFGEEMWTVDMSGDGSTLEANVKDSTIENVKQIHLMAAHAEEYKVELTEDDDKTIKETAASIMESWDDALIKATGADEKYLIELLGYSTLADKVYQAAIADVDTEVSDEEAAQKSISYAFISTAGTPAEDGTTTALTDDEKAALKVTAQTIADTAKTGGDFQAAVEGAGYTVYDDSYGADSTDLDAALIAAAEALTDGGVSDVIEGDGAYYVVKMVSTADAEATATRKEEIVAERQNTAFADIYAAWEKEVEFKLDEEVWATITFDEPIIVAEETTAEETTEETAAEETTEEK